MREQEKLTILERMIEWGFPIERLYAKRSDVYAGQIARLILASDAIAKRAKLDWEYKSLAELGEELFISLGSVTNEERWEQSAIRNFSSLLCPHIWYEEEGLLFFVRTKDGKFRPAKVGDPSYDFVRRLDEEGAVFDLVLNEVPRWAQELFVNKINYDAYCLVWHDQDGKAYDQHKAILRDAVLQETQRRLGGNRRVDIAHPNESTLADARERGSLLRIVRSLDVMANLPDRGAASAIELQLQQLGFGSPKEATIRKILDEARKLEADEKPQLRKSKTQ